MNLEKIEQIIQGEASYRKKQIKKCLFQDLISDWSEATVLSLDLRQKLNKLSPISIEAQVLISKNQKSRKALITLQDKEKVETVLMCYNGNRNTVCVSSQIGCSLNCAFCATGREGFTRNLSFSEIIEQVLFFARSLKKEGKKITNIVFMGMGEPLLNYNNVIRAIEILNDKDGFNLGIRSFSISTSGIIEGIEKLTNENKEINLAVSLNASNSKLRSQLMPINNQYPLNKLLKAIDKYIDKNRRKVMFEYIMIKGINDSDENALELLEIVKNRLCFVNLIPCNPIGEKFQPSTTERIKKFRKVLEKGKITVTQRYLFGDDISAACGQLAGQDKKSNYKL